MDFVDRLTREDVQKQLRRARECFTRTQFIVGSPLHTSSDFQELGLVSHDDQLDAIKTILSEISENVYNGPHPPNHKSGELKCKGATMLQFAWDSKCFDGSRMYFKFCINQDRLVVLRIHLDFKKKEKK